MGLRRSPRSCPRNWQCNGPGLWFSSYLASLIAYLDLGCENEARPPRQQVMPPALSSKQKASSIGVEEGTPAEPPRSPEIRMASIRAGSGLSWPTCRASVRPRTTYPTTRFRAHGEYLIELLDALHVDRVKFVGFSLGGGVVRPGARGIDRHAVGDRRPGIRTHRKPPSESRPAWRSVGPALDSQERCPTLWPPSECPAHSGIRAELLRFRSAPLANHTGAVPRSNDHSRD